jgi:hypothetical protein
MMGNLCDHCSFSHWVADFKKKGVTTGESHSKCIGLLGIIQVRELGIQYSIAFPLLLSILIINHQQIVISNALRE